MYRSLAWFSTSMSLTKYRERHRSDQNERMSDRGSPQPTVRVSSHGRTVSRTATADLSFYACEVSCRVRTGRPGHSTTVLRPHPKVTAKLRPRARVPRSCPKIMDAHGRAGLGVGPRAAFASESEGNLGGRHHEGQARGWRVDRALRGIYGLARFPRRHRATAGRGVARSGRSRSRGGTPPRRRTGAGAPPDRGPERAESARRRGSRRRCRS